MSKTQCAGGMSMCLSAIANFVPERWKATIVTVAGLLFLFFAIGWCRAHAKENKLKIATLWPAIVTICFVTALSFWMYQALKSKEGLEFVTKTWEVAQFQGNRNGVMFIVSGRVRNDGPDTTIDNWILVIRDRNNSERQYYLREPKLPFVAAGRRFDETDSLAEKTALKRLNHGDSEQGFLAFEAYDFNLEFFLHEGTKIELLFNGGKRPYRLLLEDKPPGSSIGSVTPVTEM